MRAPLRHLYLHIPFCAKICPYCAFYVERKGVDAQSAFVAALCSEWRQARDEFDFSVLETIYFGGGTPSILSPELFRELAQEMPVPTAEREVTLEANPATVTPAKAAAWRQAGVNRISLGAQSFDASALRLLGRQHQPEEIASTCQLLRAEGFDNLAIDLMFALPGQTEASWGETLRAALACAPQHVSAYALTYEEDTPFFAQLQQGVWQLDEAREIALFEQTREVLRSAGLIDYEISNFARPGFASRHNLAYWQGADYLGLGPSACSTIAHQRWKNVPNLATYQERLRLGVLPREEIELLDASLRQRERIMFGLRQKTGVALAEFFELLSPVILNLESDGLAERRNDRLVLTERGQLVADGVAALFA